MEVLMIDTKFLESNFDRIEGGYICKKTKVYMSDDMKTILVGKRVTVSEINADDPKLDVVVEGLNIPSLWILKKAPARRRAKAGSTVAGDGSAYGPVFINLLKAHPELKGFTTNRFSRLTEKEKKDICSVCGIEYNPANQQAIYEEIAIKFIE